eukprot:12925092-Alexandrium_andersonii.AAC.1
MHVGWAVVGIAQLKDRSFGFLGARAGLACERTPASDPDASPPPDNNLAEIVAGSWAMLWAIRVSVSYTHLTLPTICSV